MNDNTIHPHTRIGALLLFLRNNPEEALQRGDAAIKLGCAPAAVDGLMSAHVASGLVTLANDGDLGRVWRAGPLLGTAKVLGNPDTPAPAGRTAQPAAKSKRGGTRSILPRLDLGSLQVASGTPMPPARYCVKGQSRHDAVFDQLTADGMCVTGIPASYWGALSKALQTYLQARPALQATSTIVPRRLDNNTMGLWRITKPATPTKAPKAPKA